VFIGLLIATIVFSYVCHILFSLHYLVSTMIGIIIFYIIIPYIIKMFMLNPPWHIPASNPNDGLPSLIKGKAKEYYKDKITNPLVDYNLQYKDFTIKTYGEDPKENYELRGWHIVNNNKDACIIFVHGGARDRRAFMRHLPCLHKYEYGLIAFDCREHGTSTCTGKGIGWTVREAEDVVTVSKYAREALNYKHVILIGTSQGAASCIIAASFDPLINLIIAENPYSCRKRLMKDIMLNVMGNSYILSFLQNHYINYIIDMVQKYLNVDETKHPNAIDIIQDIKQPILFMHGDNDTLVPVEHSKDLYNKASHPKKLWICKGASHTALYDHSPHEWEKIVYNFIRKHGY
jgi:pimeloyl-ACP methyl ester carboxylesterase